MSTLSDRDVRKSIADFISEAKQCAERGNGFAAMSTIFNVVLAVSEAAFQTQGNRSLISRFVPEMTNMPSWLVTSMQRPSTDEVVDLLVDTRNGFAHSLSMPPKVILHDTLEEAVNSARMVEIASNPEKMYFVSVIDFVNDVEATVKNLCASHSNAEFDPFKGQTVRGPARSLSLRS